MEKDRQKTTPKLDFWSQKPLQNPSKIEKNHFKIDVEKKTKNYLESLGKKTCLNKEREARTHIRVVEVCSTKSEMSKCWSSSSNPVPHDKARQSKLDGDNLI